MKIHNLQDGVQYWYDKSTRCWWAARFDASGNQIGKAIDAATRAEIVRLARAYLQAPVS